MEKNKSTFRQEGNRLIHTRLLDAPRELVWEVWTNPEHLKNWWGPNGFTLTNKSMEVQPGKYWNFIMHGMGQDFDNSIQYTEVIKPSLLAYKHFGFSEELSLPKPPRITLRNDLFIPLHIIYESIAPDDPTNAPVIINAVFSKVKPMPAAAQPE